MTNLHQGAITIDDMDISKLAGSDICAKINVVPQEAFFLPGTIRFNLDPQGRASENAIEAAIRRVGLWGRITRAEAGLDMELLASEWSHGEMQLLCLARALLVPSKILILDEATSRYKITPRATEFWRLALSRGS
jgi:ABC-type multidrug transport system fused ATPase/permease subunit